MKEWTNNTLLEQITIEKTKYETYPIICPICSKKDCHIYMHLHNEKTRRGGLWIWCSNCRCFEHSQYFVPSFWENCEKIDHTQLCAIPGYLDNNKKMIDEHINNILKGTQRGSTDLCP